MIFAGLVLIGQMFILLFSRFARGIFTVMCIAGILPLARGATPPTKKEPVTDQYHGVKVVDGYRWLENTSNPEVKEWSQAQTRHARAYLDALPDRAAIETRL